MAYLVAQMIKNAAGRESYMKPVEGIKGVIIDSPNPFGGDLPFKDFAIKISNGKFQLNNTYYIRFKIHRVPQYYYSGSKTGWDPNKLANADELGINLVFTDGLEFETKNPQEEGYKTPEIVGSFEVPKSSEKIIDDSDNQEKEDELYASYSFVFTPSMNF